MRFLSLKYVSVFHYYRQYISQLHAESLPSLPPEDLDNIVCISSPALQLCGFTVGEPVLISESTVNPRKGLICVKSVWPSSEKTITSVLMTKEGELLANFNFVAHCSLNF